MYDTDVMMVGHFARDRIVVDGCGVDASGGAVYYGGIALRRTGLSVTVITRLHPADRRYLDDLIQAGVQVYAADAPETSGIENTYSSTDMERRVCRLLGFAGAFRKDELPDLAAKVYLVTPIIAGEISLPILDALASCGPVGLDVQGFVRVRRGEALVFQPWEDIAEGLSRVTYLKVDQAEAELLTGKSDLCAAAEALAAYGPREIVLTQSSGVTVYADGQFYQAPFTSRSLVGRTGRGDTCFAAYVGRRQSSSAGAACRFAAAVTSLKQEQPGPWNGSLSALEALLSKEQSRRIG
jgi:sugar/nucleoside kinase (ribokinase family)